IGEGNTGSDVTFLDVDVVHTGTAKSKPLAEVRGGNVTLNNVRIAAESWNGTFTIITAGSRTKSLSCPINVTVRDCSIDLGSTGCVPVYYGGNSNEVNGYEATVYFYNSTVATSGKVVKTNPTEAAAPNCSIDIYFDSTCVIKGSDIFEINKISTDMICVSIDLGARFSSIPSVLGASHYYGGDVFVYNNETALFTMVDSAAVDTSKIACKLVDTNGDVLCYWEGNQLTKELVAYAQTAGCNVVLLADMTTPNGTNQNSRYEIVVDKQNLTIDLSGNTLYTSEWSYFGTNESSKELKLINGTVECKYYIFYSYTAPNTSIFVGENLNCTVKSNVAPFDLRAGIITLTDCTVDLAGTTSTIGVFTLGNTTRTTPVTLYLYGCEVRSYSAQQYIFRYYQGQPCKVVAEDSVLSVGSEAYIAYGSNGRCKTPTDTLSLKNCTLSKGGDNLKLFDFSNYTAGTVSISLDEIYVATNSLIETSYAKLIIADGQTKATVSDGGYMITKPKVQLSANLSLYTDFTVNIWLPEGTTVSSLNVDGVDYPISSAVKIGDRYRISICSIGAAEAADAISILITYTDGERTLTVEKAYSVITYAQSIIEADSYSEESKSLIAYVIGYIDSVYAYSQKAAPAELSALIASEDYIAALALDSTDGVESVPETETDIGTAVNAISGARLLLDSSVKFIFALNEGYTGSLTLSYAGSSYECEVVNGTVGECDYVIVDMRAAALYSEVITITAGEYSGTYDLAAYVAGISEDYGTSDELTALLVSLYNYCKEANEYKAYVAESGELN
ncbi:MAG: hypothetical protein IJF05_03655, partial [Clostridia bacterium]|nr:hypothetical protein [Clostridia bacterium]